MDSKTKAPRILIVEDDPTTAENVAAIATSLGCEPIIMRSFADGIEATGLADFSVIVLDRMLPGGDGVDAIAKMRLKGSRAMILMLSALGRSGNKIEGLEKGADDYLAKPFDPSELKARMRALLRRATMQLQDNDILTFGALEIRLKARTVHVGQTHVTLTPKEFTLLSYLAENSGELVTRMQLLEHVWNLHFDPQTNVVDVHVGRLRRKLEEVQAQVWIETQRGEGYTFLPKATS